MNSVDRLNAAERLEILKREATILEKQLLLSGETVSLLTYINHLKNQEHSPNTPYIKKTFTEGYARSGERQPANYFQFVPCVTCQSFLRQKHVDRYRTIHEAY